MLDCLRDRHPYLRARQLFLAGQITRLNAAGMMARDREFIAECELNGLRPIKEARRIVRDRWLPELVKCSQTINRS